MDLKNEDTMVKQIESNLSNHFNENLSGNERVHSLSSSQTTSNKKAVFYKEDGNEAKDYPLVSYDYPSETFGVSRAEFIHQAREACLRQLSAQHLYTKPFDSHYTMYGDEDMPEGDRKRERALELFDKEYHDTSYGRVNKDYNIAGYRSLVIRCVCAILLFITIFLFDKFKLEVGKMTHTIIKDYVTGKDALVYLEDIFVTWLK